MSTLISTLEAGNFSLALINGGQLDVQVEPALNPATTFARNSATGPNADTPITSTANPPTQVVTWTFIEAGTEPSVNVPITPRITGTIQMIAVLNVSNTTGAAIEFSAAFTVNALSFSPNFIMTVPAGGVGHVSMLLTLKNTPVGTNENIGVVVSGNGLTLLALSSAIAVQELQNAG